MANLGIQRIDSLEICVHDAEPWIAYLTSGFGFQPVAVSTEADVESRGYRRHLLRCGEIDLVLAESVVLGSRAERLLDRHPEGLSRIGFLVNDLAATEQRLVERNATPIDFIRSEPIAGGAWKELAIATPLGDVELYFVERPKSNERPGMEPTGQFDASCNPLGLKAIDHLTANTRTLMPTIAFFEHVMGFNRLWDVQFHSEDVQPGVGTGLKSVVMWDESSGVKIALNEPLRPRFDRSQVQLSIEVHRGAGIHHLAWEVSDLLAAVDHSRSQGVEFMPTPAAYYEAMPQRIASRKIGPVAQKIDDLKSRDILLDGDQNGYLLQAFTKNGGGRFARPKAGPLLIELVQRCGAAGFGEGNFRALFDAMQAQRKMDS
ncbi:MAG: 4-hydroxyphenylpyruvate dioxygenase family protein [Phycisphaerae bacterium]